MFSGCRDIGDRPNPVCTTSRIILAVLSGHRRFFLTALATFLFAFPFVLSGLNLAVPRNAVGFGFSGINMALAGVMLGTLYASSAGIRLRQPVPTRVRTVASRTGYGDLFAVSTALFVGYPIVGFPSDPATGGTVVNLYVHLLGFCLAFIGPFTPLAAGVFDE